MRDDATLLLTFDPLGALIAKVASHVCVAVFHEFGCTPLGCVGEHFVPRAEYPYYVLVPSRDVDGSRRRTSQWRMIVDRGQRMDCSKAERIHSSLVVPETYSLRQGPLSYRIVRPIVAHTGSRNRFWQDVRSTLYAICQIWRLEGNVEKAELIEWAIVLLKDVPERIAFLEPHLLTCSPYALGDPFWYELGFLERLRA